MTDQFRSSLAAPFPAKDIEWRIARSGLKDGKPWGMCLAYLTNRAIMERLDDVVGPMGWRNEYQRWGDKGVLCGLSLWDGQQWITKWDGAEETDFEAVKGGLSGAMKRAAVQWGIGRYLYDLPEGWATFPANGKGPYSAKIDGTYYKWAPPELPSWALPTGDTRSKASPPSGAIIVKYGAVTGPEGQVLHPARQPLNEAPAALDAPDTPEVFDDVDPATGEIPEVLSEAQTIDLRALVKSAGISGKDWPTFYRQATGRDYSGKIYVGDRKPLATLAAKLLARKKSA